jgi:DNA polymerase
MVLGVGTGANGIMFIGEAPGREEDDQGEPFVGKSGKLFNKALEAAGISRDESYITNIVKCRPPENRDPTGDEILACVDKLVQEIELVNPKVLVCVGRVSSNYLIHPDFKITREHGSVFTFGSKSIPTIAIYHPAYLLRREGDDLKKTKREMFNDLLKIKGHVAMAL